MLLLLPKMLQWMSHNMSIDNVTASAIAIATLSYVCVLYSRVASELLSPGLCVNIYILAVQLLRSVV
jgi:hypothetical protein